MELGALVEAQIPAAPYLFIEFNQIYIQNGGEFASLLPSSKRRMAKKACTEQTFLQIAPLSIT